MLTVARQPRGDKDRVPLQWRNHLWQGLKEGAGKRRSGCESAVDRWTLPRHLNTRHSKEGGKRERKEEDRNTLTRAHTHTCLLSTSPSPRDA